ncbi:MAG: hypothetical protein ABIP74_00380 [Candidatus Saccharimonas sp.]
MIPHELTSPTQHEADAMPAASALEVSESRQMSYNPDAVGTLTAEQDSAIEDMANEALANGTPVDEVQTMVYDRLAELGFDLSGAQHNALVVKYEGIDGKAGVLRAITLRPDDFGVVIRNAELVAAQPRVEQVSDEPTSVEELAHYNENEEGRREVLDELVTEISTLEESLDANETAETELMQVSVRLVDTMKADFINRLMLGQPIDMSRLHFTKLQAQELLRGLESQKNTVKEQISHTIESSDARFGESGADTEDDTGLKEIKTLAGMVNMNRRNRVASARYAYNACGVLSGVLARLEAGAPVDNLLDTLNLNIAHLERNISANTLDRDMKTLLGKLKERVISK